MKKLILPVIVLSIIINVSCSSSPKNAGEVNTIKRQAESGLRNGNLAAGQGQLTNALLLLTEAKRKAIIVDDPSLIIRTSLSRGNVLLQLNRDDEAFSEWDEAIQEAQRIKNAEFVSVCLVFRARGLLLSQKDTPRNVLEIITREHSNIKSRYYTAFSFQTRGLVLRALGSYAEAENALKQSLDINLKDRYLEYASFDWYTIASVRSLAGNFNGALQALEESMAIDRRIENSWGLAASWNAMGDVYGKMGREADAKAARERAEAILKALN